MGISAVGEGVAGMGTSGWSLETLWSTRRHLHFPQIPSQIHTRHPSFTLPPPPSHRRPPSAR
ncbi:hypothetical protein C2E23DRAFT_852726 [Lenzites betulinus]|nr:hypothetical protein C2E23DRAFT_852726 [Lenzites betulinus]